MSNYKTLPYNFESVAGIICAKVAAAVISVTIPTTELAAPGEIPGW